jgi:probable HAF family extracellular repeat protein
MQYRRTFALWLFLLCLISSPTVAQVYKVTDLGTLSPTAINNWGQVAANLNGRAYIWTQWGRLDLGTLTGGTFSNAVAINDFAEIVGTADGPGTVISANPSVIPNQQCSGLTQPFVWTPMNGMQGLGTVYFGPEQGSVRCTIPFYGTGVNALGQVVGDTTDWETYQFGFLWTRTHGMSLLGTSWPPTVVNGVSNTGQIVGQNGEPGGLYIGHGTSWKSGVTTDLGTLGNGEESLFYGSSANGVNDSGQVVGWSTTAPQPIGGCYSELCPIHAVLWTPSGAISDLGTLAGDTVSAASNINFFGQVIGCSGTKLVWQGWGRTGGPIAVVGRPFIWSARDGMRDLNTLISPESGWVLNSVAGINFWGQIVGSGTRNGKPHGFLLTPKFSGYSD